MKDVACISDAKAAGMKESARTEAKYAQENCVKDYESVKIDKIFIKELKIE
jgi:hypothetical protein